METKYKTAPTLKAVKEMVEGDHADSVKAVGAAFLRKIAALKEVIQKKQNEINQAIEMSGDKVAAKKHYDAEMADWLRNFRRESEADRYGLLKDLQGVQESLSYARINLTDPRKLATGFGLGDERRSRIEQSLATAGPTELGMLAARAEVESDQCLAAALINVNSNLPRPQRGFNSTELSEKLFGKEARDAKEMVDAASYELDRALAVNREFNGDKPTGFDRVNAGFKHPGKTLVPSDKPAPSNGTLSSVDKIQNALQRADEYKKKLDAA